MGIFLIVAFYIWIGNIIDNFKSKSSNPSLSLPKNVQKKQDKSNTNIKGEIAEKEREKNEKAEKVQSIRNIYTNTEYQGLDLGLSVNWGEYNLKKIIDGQIVEFIEWGGIFPKTVICNKGLLHPSFNNENYFPEHSICSNSSFDIATNELGSQWRLPSNLEAGELLSHCRCKFININGCKGFLLESNNGNSIFLPYSFNGKYGITTVYWTGNSAPDTKVGDCQLKMAYAIVLSSFTANETPTISIQSVSRTTPGFAIPIYQK